jgi:uncharacterized Zn-finger protein
MMNLDQHKTLTHQHSSQVEVTSTMLPLSCPMPDAPLWNAHPKVFLPIADTGKATCPYCGMHYVMTDWHEGGHHH